MKMDTITMAIDCTIVASVSANWIAQFIKIIGCKTDSYYAGIYYDCDGSIPHPISQALIIGLCGIGAVKVSYLFYNTIHNIYDYAVLNAQDNTGLMGAQIEHIQ